MVWDTLEHEENGGKENQRRYMGQVYLDVVSCLITHTSIWLYTVFQFWRTEVVVLMLHDVTIVAAVLVLFVVAVAVFGCIHLSQRCF